jgi:NAD(P)H dehydrogenase (quinone)
MSTLLVTGASGHLGRRVVELLLEANAGQIIATTRTPDKLAEFAQRGVVVRQADFDNADSLPAAFAGADRLLLISTDAVDVPGRRLNHQRAAIKAAEAAGVKHIVYTSIMNPVPENPAFVVPDHHGTEEALAASGIGWTALRENLYAEVLVGSLSQAIASGSLYSGAGDGKAAYITREDCARASAAALASSFDSRRTVNITGPDALSQADAAALASSISGRPVAYVPLPIDAVIEGMVGAGLPRPMAEAYATFDAAIAQDFFSAVSNGVEELTGRKPIRIADYLAENLPVRS